MRIPAMPVILLATAAVMTLSAYAQTAASPAAPETKPAPVAPCANPPCGGPGSGSGMGAGKGGGMGPRAGGAHRGDRFGRDNTAGWSLMTPQERQAHRDKMMSIKNLDECKAYLEAHRKDMEARAKEKGKPMPAAPRTDMCERMNSRGRFGQK